MDKSGNTNSKKKNSLNVINDTYLLQQAKEFSSMLKTSSGYWKGTFSSIKNNFISTCTKQEKKEEQTNTIPEVEKNKTKSITSGDKIKISPLKNLNKHFDEFKSDNNPLHQFFQPPTHIIENESSKNIFNFDSENISLNKKFWTKDEDEKLIQLVNKSKGKNWKKISHLLTSKTAQQCAYRYNKLISNLNNRKWSRNEDIILIELIEIYGQNWQEICNRMEGRTFEEVKERFEIKLDPKLKRSNFKKEEDEMILAFFEKYGNKWDEIAKYFVDRSADMIKNRFYSHLKKNKNKNSSNVDTSQNENNFDTKFVLNSSQNYLDRKDMQLEENKLCFNLDNKNSDRKVFDSNLDSENFNDNIKKRNDSNDRYTTKYEEYIREKNQEMYPDNLKYVSPITEDISMNLNSHEAEINQINQADYFNQNLDGFFNFNINEKSNSKTLLEANNSLFDSEKSNFLYNFSSLKNNLNPKQNLNNLNTLEQGRRENENKILFKNTNNLPQDCQKSNQSSNINKSFTSKLDSLIHNKKIKIENHNLSPYQRNQSSDMILDDSEANDIPKQMIAIDTNSPTNDFLTEDPELNFNKHYENIFKCKKNSFEQENFLDIRKTSSLGHKNFNAPRENNYFLQNPLPSTNLFSNTVNITNTTNNIHITGNFEEINNDALYKQYKLLEDVFKKVKDVSMYQVNEQNVQNNFSGINDLKKNELIEVNQNLEGKKEMLNEKLNELKREYFSLNSKSQLDLNLFSHQAEKIPSDVIRNSLMTQIDILIDLINTTKKKITLMEQIENEMR